MLHVKLLVVDREDLVVPPVQGFAPPHLYHTLSFASSREHFQLTLEDFWY